MKPSMLASKYILTVFEAFFCIAPPTVHSTYYGKYLRWLFASMVMVMTPALAQGQETYIFNPDSTSYTIGEVGLLPVCDSALGLSQVKEQVFEYGSNPIYKKGCKHWLKLQVFIPDSLEGQYLIEQPYKKGITHYYTPNSLGQYVHTQSGTDSPPEERSFNFPRYTKSLIYLRGGDTSTIYIYHDYAAKKEKSKVLLYLTPFNKQIRADEATEYHILLVSVALLGLLALYNAFIFFYTKDRSYLYYALTFLAFAIHISTIQEYYLTWTAHLGYFWDYVFIGMIAIGIAMYFIFSLFYLEEKQNRLPQLKRRVTITVRVSIFFLLIFLFGQFLFSLPILIVVSYFTNACVVLSILTLLYYAIRLSQKGQQTARYYIYASLTTLPFICLYLAQGSDLTHRGYLGLIPSSTLTRMSLPMGIVAQALAFSLALGARINIMRKDITAKEAEKERLEKEQLLERNRLAEQQKEELEVTVRERTQSLQEANEELRMSEERLEQINKTKDHFFAVLAHDLRGPVASFQGISQTLQYQIKKKNEDRVKQIMDQMEKSSTHLNLLLDNLLQWAQSQLGGMTFRPKPVSLKDLAHEVQEIYSTMAQSKGVTTTLRIEHGEIMLWVDEPSTATIIRNLWGNAMKYTEQGNITLYATAQEGQAHIVISDTGKGIPSEKLPNIFDVNQEKIERGTRGEKGNGLGLALCQEFALKNHGDIRIESQAGKGTTVHLYMPIWKESI